MQSLNRKSPLDLGRGYQTLNRVVVPAMASETADENGFATAKSFAHYQRLTESGAGLINVEYTYVHLSGRSEPYQLSASSDEHIPGLTKIAAIIKKSGAIAGLQLVHSGGKTSRDLTNGLLMAPSAIAVPVKDRILETPDAMSMQEIELWQHSFLAAADRAVHAGFDLVELHSAHGYGLNQWLSPVTNQRKDAYGKTLRGRMRMLTEIISLIRSAYPNLLLAVRIPGQDFTPGGLTIEDMKIVANELVELDTDIINVSSGLGGWRRPRDRDAEGYLVEEAIKIQAVINAPVIGVGGIESGEYIDTVITNRQISLAAVGRAILRDPAAWHSKILT